MAGKLFNNINIGFHHNVKARTFLCKCVCIILCLVLSVPSFLPVQAAKIPTEDRIIKQIEDTYDEARRYSGYSSFNGYCAHYVNLQLMLLGINTGYVGGNGNDEYDNYKNLSYSTGGYKIHNYPATNATMSQTLYDIADNASVVTNVLVGFQKSATSAGSKYGHAFFIHAIIGEYVYFSDSYTLTVGGVRYTEGKPIKCTIDQLVRYYGVTGGFTLEGIIWFEDTELTAELGGSGGSDDNDTGTDDTTDIPDTGDGAYTPGKYKVTASAGLRVRAAANTNAESLTVMPYNTEVMVLEVSENDWGRVFYDGYEGWCSLSYATRTANLPSFCLEVRENGALISISEYSDIDVCLKAADCADRYVYNIIVGKDITLNSDLKIVNGVTLELGDYSLLTGNNTLTVAGGTVTAGQAIDSLEADPFVTSNAVDGKYTYTCDISFAFTAVNLVLNDNVSLRFTSTVSGLPLQSGITVSLICVDADGNSKYYAPSSVVGTEYQFTTDGIPAKKLGDRVSAGIELKATVGGKTYTALSDTVSYSPADYVAAVYGNGAKLDKLLASMLNYSTAAQTYFDYNASSPANTVLPAADRVLKSDKSTLVEANTAPVVFYDSSAHISAVQLILLDTVALRLHADGIKSGSEYSLLVWTEADYLAQKQKADAAGDDVSNYLTSSTASMALNGDKGEFTLYGISAKKYADTYYFRLCEKTGGKTYYDYVVSYSVTSYCAYKVNDGIEDSIDRLCFALAEYSAAARDYFDYKING